MLDDAPLDMIAPEELRNFALFFRSEAWRNQHEQQTACTNQPHQLTGTQECMFLIGAAASVIRPTLPAPSFEVGSVVFVCLNG
jgi:hypothetical protein